MNRSKIVDLGSYRQSRMLLDCLDCIEALPIAVDEMRAASNPIGVIETMANDAKLCLQRLDDSGQDTSILCTFAADTLYRRIAALEVCDVHTEGYCALVIQPFLHQLILNGTTIFYIVDNEIRQDRFEAIVRLFDASGIRVVSPRLQGSNLESLRSEILTKLGEPRHVAYIEPDDSVNYIEAILSMSGEVSSVTTFRNLSPEEPELTLLS